MKKELIEFLKIISIRSLSIKEIEKCAKFTKWLNSIDSPHVEAPKVSKHEQPKEVCGCNAPAYLDDHRDLRCTQCDEILDYR